MADRKKFLRRTLAILAMVAAIAAAYPFLRTFPPNAVANAKATFIIDTTELSPGEILKTPTEFGEYWVIRRSDEQIEWLRSNPGPKTHPLLDNNDKNSLPTEADETLRSVDPEFFVLMVSTHQNNYVVVEGARQGWFYCKDLVLVNEAFETSRGINFLGGLLCKPESGDEISFNLAGRPDIEWFWPLAIPKHRYVDGKIIVGPAT